MSASDERRELAQVEARIDAINERLVEIQRGPSGMMSPWPVRNGETDRLNAEWVELSRRSYALRGIR